MDKENQSKKKLSAPEVDHMIYQAEHMPDISDDRTKPLVLKLFQKLQSIETCGDDELRELWLTAPRDSIEKFGDYESYLEDGEVESRKEFEELWFQTILSRKNGICFQQPSTRIFTRFLLITS